MTIQELNDKFSKFTGIRKDIGALIEGASTKEEKQKVYDHLMWHLRRGRILERPWDKALFEAIVPALQEKLNIESSVVEEVEEQETYSAEEAAAYNAQLPGAKTTDDWKVEPVEAQDAIEAQNAVYSFESFGDAEATNKYGDGTVEVIEMRAGGATVKVLTNNALDPNAEDFVGQEFNIATGLATNDPIQLYTLNNEPIDIWVVVTLKSDAVEAQEAIEAVEGVKYTQEEVDAYNATLDGAKKAGDPK